MKTLDEKTFTVAGLEITAHKVNHDVNGNPRWVVHFLDLLTDAEREDCQREAQAQQGFAVPIMFEKALAKARKVGGCKYRAKWFGGGIVFQGYHIEGDISQVIEA
jgi:hypothetical protein